MSISSSKGKMFLKWMEQFKGGKMPAKTFMFTRTVIVNADTMEEAKEDLQWLLNSVPGNVQDWSCDEVESQPEDIVDEL